MRPWTSRTVLLGSAGLGLTLLGAALYFVRQVFFHYILESSLALKPNSKSYEMWKDTDHMNTHLDIYFFNWTNPEDLLDPNKKPILVQLGPYSFRERREKVNIVFNSENDTVSYQLRRTWFFNQSRSNGSLDDMICEPNIVAVSAAHKIRFWPYMIQQSLSYMLDQFSNKHYIVRTVDELLFTGFDDKIITMGKMSVLDDEVPPFDRFGWFYMRNTSTMFDGDYNVGTGIDDIENLGKVNRWQFKNSTKFYKSPCNLIEGTAGEFWPPYRTKEDIKFFTPDICRPVTFEFENEVNHKGINGYKFAIGKKTLSNDTRRRYPHEQAKYFESTTTTEDFFAINPTTTRPEPELDEDPDLVNEGQCYCNGECAPMGLINVTACRYGAPGFISLPHFNKGDVSLVTSFEGIKPDEDKHSFYVTLEPTTGIPIDVAARLQVNILMHPSKTVEMFRQFPTLYFPIFWFEMKVSIPDDMIGKLQLLLNLPTIFTVIGLFLMFIGATLLLAFAILCYISNQRRFVKKNSKADSSQIKTEVLYMDKTGANEDTQTDRRLYSKD